MFPFASPRRGAARVGLAALAVSLVAAGCTGGHPGARTAPTSTPASARSSAAGSGAPGAGGKTSSAPAGTQSPSASPTSAAATRSPGAPGTPAASTPVTSAARCGNASLAVTRTFTQGGAGHGWMSLIYRNAGTHPCTVYGYPGLDAIGATGRVLAHAARTLSGYGNGGHLATVTIRPGGFASAGVEWLNFNPRTGGACAFSTTVRTIVAGTSAVHRLPVAVSACALQVHPTVAGTPRYPGYGPAQQNWITGAKAIAARTNLYLTRAEHALESAHAYPTQVAQLAQLIALPITGLTPAQIRTARHDTTALNGFFGTPGLYF